jgi:hypothetical protein
VPAWLGRVVMRLLEKQPVDRFADAGALMRALEHGEAEPDGAAAGRQSVADGARGLAAPLPPGPPPWAPGGALAGAPYAPVPMAPAAPVAAGAMGGLVGDATRWMAKPVVAFRRKLVRWGIIGTGLAVLSLTADSDLFFGTLCIAVYLAYKYSKLWIDGYDWRDVFRHPRDRLFFDVAAESIDSARALFDRDKRAAVRERMRLSAGQDAARPAPSMAMGVGPSDGSARGTPGAPMMRPGLASPPPAAPLPPPPPIPLVTTPPDEAAGLATGDVLNGKHGAIVRRAAGDRAAIRQEVARLGAADRALLPDVVATVDALVTRIASLATALHRLDGDLAPDALPELDRRIADAEAEPTATPDRDRKQALLRRQRATLQDLADRRATLSAQLENAGLVMRNIRLDLVRLRSAGVQSAIDDVATATQEARALSREIAHVLNAAEELKNV